MKELVEGTQRVRRVEGRLPESWSEPGKPGDRDDALVGVEIAERSHSDVARELVDRLPELGDGALGLHAHRQERVPDRLSTEGAALAQRGGDLSLRAMSRTAKRPITLAASASSGVCTWICPMGYPCPEPAEHRFGWSE